MINNFLQNKWISRLFYILILLYGFLLITANEFGVVDDHIIVNSILNNTQIPYFIIESIGRYYPLNGQEINIIGLLYKTPVAFYLYNFFQFFLIIFLLMRLLTLLFGEKYRNLFYLLVLMLIFTPGFSSSWFRLLVPERSLFFLLMIFVCFYFAFQNQQKLLYFSVILIVSCIALFYKETVFILFLTLGVSHLIFGYKELNGRQKFLDFLLIIISFIWLATYYWIVYVNRDVASYGDGAMEGGVIKTLVSYSLSDPFLVFLVMTIFITRVWLLSTRRENLSPLYDSLLVASFFYFIAYLKLGIYNFYYLLPVYSFIFIIVLHFLMQKGYWKYSHIKWATILSIFIFFLSSLPLGLHVISHYKNTPYNYQKSLSFLSDYINNSDNKLVIHVDGIKGSNNEPVVSIDKYLSYYGVDNNKYTLTYGEDNNNKDLIFITSSTMININDKYFSNLLTNYKIIFMKKSTFEVPDFSFRALIKAALIKHKPVYVNNHNMTHKSDFYILEKIGREND